MLDIEAGKFNRLIYINLLVLSLFSQHLFLLFDRLLVLLSLHVLNRKVVLPVVNFLFDS